MSDRGVNADLVGWRGLRELPGECDPSLAALEERANHRVVDGVLDRIAIDERADQVGHLSERIDVLARSLVDRAVDHRGCRVGRKEDPRRSLGDELLADFLEGPLDRRVVGILGGLEGQAVIDGVGDLENLRRHQLVGEGLKERLEFDQLLLGRVALGPRGALGVVIDTDRNRSRISMALSVDRNRSRCSGSEALLELSRTGAYLISGARFESQSLCSVSMRLVSSPR